MMAGNSSLDVVFVAYIPGEENRTTILSVKVEASQTDDGSIRLNFTDFPPAHGTDIASC